jgi:type II secretory pathway pseudopilin PulG
LAALRRERGRGFTYLGLMFLIALMGMAAAMASAVWSTTQRRDNERELVFAGRQFAAAIERYRKRSTDAARLYPRSLQELVLDDRGGQVHHHLRRIFVDPLTGSRRWGLIQLPDGGIIGVHSLSERVPFERGFVMADFPVPKDSRSYQDWHFVAPSAMPLAMQAGLVRVADGSAAVQVNAPAQAAEQPLSPAQPTPAAPPTTAEAPPVTPAPAGNDAASKGELICFVDNRPCIRR